MPDNTVTVVYIADVVGEAGRNALKKHFPGIISRFHPHLVICNAENASGGYGLTERNYHELIHLGIDVLTSGNHIWDKKEIMGHINAMERLLRPANYPPGVPGRGAIIIPVRNEAIDVEVAVINLMGRVFMLPVDCPFQTIDALLEVFRARTPLVIVDFHAEATSEKQALSYYLDGRVSAVIGSHTHVQTSDARVLDGGTGYITDAGMTGPVNSVIGMDITQAVSRFLYTMPGRLKVATGRCMVQGLMLELEIESGRCVKIEPFTYTTKEGD